MTGAERLIAMGEARGEAEGEVKGQANALLKLLRAKFPGAVDATVEARVRAVDDDLAGVFEEG